MTDISLALLELLPKHSLEKDVDFLRKASACSVSRSWTWKSANRLAPVVASGVKSSNTAQ